MERTMKEFYYPSHGAGQIHACQWNPNVEVRAVLQIVHGVSEYIERYNDFAHYLNENGILVVGEDHMGHGKSVNGSSQLAYFTGGWETAIEDTYELFLRTKKQFPDTPYFLLGHSMGSFMLRTFLFKYPDSKIQGSIIMGTGWQPQIILKSGRLITELMVLCNGAKEVNRTIQNLMFGTYNKPFPNEESTFAWLNSDPECVAKYEEDALCGYPITNGLARDMIKGLSLIQRQSNLKNMPKNLPIFFMSGKLDPVGDLGKGVIKTAEAFNKAGMQNILVKLYPEDRHEILNETDRETVYEDILHWIIGNISK